MSQKRWFQYDEIKDRDSITSSKIVKSVIKSLIGTMFIETEKFKKLNDDRSIGRTFFSDRAKSSHPVNDSFITRFGYLCTDVLHGESKYDSKIASIRLVNLFREYFHIRTDFLCFSDDDDESLRAAKANAWNELLTKLFLQIKGYAKI